MNDHVLQDIEDVILLKGFVKMDHKQINTIIEEHQRKRREYSTVLYGVDESYDFKEED